MMIRKDGSTHEWVAGHKWDLIVTMDDATSEHYSMFFVEEEATMSNFQGVQEVIEKRRDLVRKDLSAMLISRLLLLDCKQGDGCHNGSALMRM